MFKPRPRCQVKYHKIYVVSCFIKDVDLSVMYDFFPFDHFIFLSLFANYLAVMISFSSKREKISSSKYAGAYSEPFQIFKKKCFTKIFNGFYLL